MNGQRKPRQPRWIMKDLGRLVSVLTPRESIDATAHACAGFKALRQGVATEIEWAHVVSAMNMADGFEQCVRPSGARGHIQAAQVALNEALRRAMATGAWCPPTLYLQEIDDIRTGIEIYQVRLRTTTFGEYRRVQAYARAEVESTGGVALQLTQAGPASAQQDLLAAT